MAKKIVDKTEGFTKRHALNLNTAISMQDMDGQRISNVKAAALVEDVDRETGELKQVGAIVDGEGRVYTTISVVIIEQMEDIIDFINDGEEFDIEINLRKTRNGSRDFLTATII